MPKDTPSPPENPAGLAEILAMQSQQLQLLQQLVARLIEQRDPTSTHAVQGVPAIDPYGDLVRDLPAFVYDKDDDTTFDAWYKRYGPVIEDRGAALTEERRRNLVIDKLDNATYKSYAEHVLPLKPRDIDFATTIQKLTLLFGPKRTLIRRRFEFLQSTCPPLTSSFVPYREFGNMVKKKFEDAAMKDVDGDSLKCLVFIAGLTDSSHSEMRLRLLNHLNRMKEDEPSPILDDFINECETFVTLRSDNRLMEQKEVNAAYQAKATKKKRQTSRKPRNPNFRHRSSSRERQPYRHSSSEKEDSPQHRAGSRRSRRNFRCKNVSTTTQDARTYLKVHINGRPTRLQLDTGADITMISRRTWKAIGSPAVERATVPVKAANGSEMEILGRFEADFAIYDRHRRPTLGHGKCYLTESTDLLGLEWCIQMSDYRQLKDQYHCRLATNALEHMRNDTVSYLRDKFADVFAPGLGRCTKTKAKLFLQTDARPVYKQKRPVPFASQPAVNAEIDRLVRENVLVAVEHSNWAAPIVVVKKSNGTVRICADFSTGLNDALILHQYPLPTIEDIFTKLNGGQFFSQVDLADAYLQVEMDDDSKELVTINTHRGLFHYNRLPFGVKSAPGIFQQIIDSMIAGLPGVAAYMDDVIVTGRTPEEHRSHLEALFQRISSYGFRVRIDKCHFFMPEIRYLGNIIDKEGRRPDPDKIRAISEMPAPKDITQLRSLLGMINYYGAFIQDMRQLRAPLDALLKKSAPFVWNAECQAAFLKAKEILASPLLLTHYDPKLELIVAADASDYGIGAVLLHRFPDRSEKAICHASRSLTDTEKKYGQIEKEGLALVYAVRKFHRYLLGRRFTLLTDHKPLVTIFGNKNGIPIYSANRLLRWSLILRGYDFKIEHRKTTEFGQADALSRLIADESFATSEDVVIAQASLDVEAHCRAVTSVLPITLEAIAEESAKDPTTKEVMEYVRQDKWPRKAPTEITRYSALRHSLSIQHDCLFVGPRIVIPPLLRRRILQLLHDGHPGATRMKMLARSYVYWTKLTQEIEEFVRNCRDCQEASKAPIKAELHSWTTEEQPWSRIHIDYAGPINGKMYLVVVDSYSKWPEIVEMPSTTSKATIRELSRLFAQFGNPETLVSDNGTQFTSSEFSDFCIKNGIAHVRSPPYHPQSNGQAERFVDSFKRGLQKLKSMESTAEALQKFLLTYRRTPCPSSPQGKSPAEIFLGRQIRTTLTLLNTPRGQPRTRNSAMEKQFNRHHGARPKEFKPNELIWVRDFQQGRNKWTSAKVLARRGSTVYDVLVNGTVQRRHANQMRPHGAVPTDEGLLDLFDLPTQLYKRDEAVSPPSVVSPIDSPTATMTPTTTLIDAATPAIETSDSSVPEPVQRPQRQRHPPRRLEMNPMVKSYI